MDNQVRSTGAESCKKFGNPWYFSFKSQGRKSSIIQRKTKPGLAPRACSLNAAVCNRCRDLSTESPKGVRHSWAGLPTAKSQSSHRGALSECLYGTQWAASTHTTWGEGSWALEAEPVCSLNCSPGRSRLLPSGEMVPKWAKPLALPFLPGNKTEVTKVGGWPEKAHFM